MRRWGRGGGERFTDLFLSAGTSKQKKGSYFQGLKFLLVLLLSGDNYSGYIKRTRLLGGGNGETMVGLVFPRLFFIFTTFQLIQGSLSYGNGC